MKQEQQPALFDTPAQPTKMPYKKSLMQTLVDLIELNKEQDTPHSRITINEMVNALGRRSFSALLILITLPACIPAPPGFSSIFGPLIILFLVQMLLGHQTPWLPARVKRWSVDAEAMENVLKRAQPYIEWFERRCRPRMLWVSAKPVLEILQAFMILLGFILTLPLPITNMFPGIAIAIMNLGLIERDGKIMLIGAGFGVFAVSVSFFMSYAIIKAILYAFSGL